ncbi:hypothetical protein O6H91_09G010100 [Diphasiastrum complanatum]|uniref:Uncharacterized protein n=3 Tax=Diphasiastrum complanatum TaxID=34168 RepID=A0ACC2CLD0_DIPCM|nr:hypothetical protein O6H91_09G010100 [Diphasiastrum complanatum]KAJ7542752.1 hypothetical protein O6H91_09G010100 [Diphasiastrum complanatum]KAJ7542753.1 hypothetical protein O6H91_09G010100 [Diphasiastrum complanatum]
MDIKEMAGLSLGSTSATSASGLDFRDHSSAGMDNLSESKKRKKQKKKKKSKCVAISILDQLHRNGAALALPSQKLAEAIFPWKAANIPNRGRSAVATRLIKAGEVIVAEQAVAFVTLSSYRTALCHACCQDLVEGSPRYECSLCSYAVYCLECQRDALSWHKKWCHVVASIKNIAKQASCDEDLLHLVLALALSKSPSLKKRGVLGEGFVGTSSDGIIYPCFSDVMGLQTHHDKAKADWKAAVRKGCESLREAITQLELEDEDEETICQTLTVEDLEMLAALVNTNAHGMGAQGPRNTDSALGIFPFVSMLNHSCRPNCCFASDHKIMYVRATRDVPKGSELCVSYINSYEPRATRKQELAVNKHFVCCCERCMEPLHLSVDRFLEGCICQVKGCGGVLIRTASKKESSSEADVALSPWECDLCSSVLDPGLPSPAKSKAFGDKPWELVSQAEGRLVAAMAVYIERRFKEARVLLEQFLADFTGKLHPLHVLLFDALTPLMNCCRAMGDAEEGSRICRTIINCLEKVSSGPTLELANFYYCLGEMHAERADTYGLSRVLAKRHMRLAHEAFEHVEIIQNVCLGKSTMASRLSKQKPE